MNKQLTLLLTIMIFCPTVIGMEKLTHRRSLSEGNSPKFNTHKNALLARPYLSLDATEQINPLVQTAQKLCPNTIQQMDADTLVSAHANTKKQYWWGPEKWQKNIVLSDDTRVLGLVLYTFFHKKICCLTTGYILQVDLIAIDPTEQRQGYGSTLLWALEKKARMHSTDLITASYPTNNNAAKFFFENHKFQEIKNDGTLVTVQKKLKH